MRLKVRWLCYKEPNPKNRLKFVVYHDRHSQASSRNVSELELQNEMLVITNTSQGLSHAPRFWTKIVVLNKKTKRLVLLSTWVQGCFSVSLAFVHRALCVHCPLVLAMFCVFLFLSVETC